jgi:hypothetical protein
MNTDPRIAETGIRRLHVIQEIRALATSRTDLPASERLHSISERQRELNSLNKCLNQ